MPAVPIPTPDSVRARPDREMSASAPRCAALQESLNKNKGKEQRADRNFGPPRTERAFESDDGLNQSENQHPDQGAKHVAHTARKQRTADNHGCNRIELAHRAGGGVA